MKASTLCWAFVPLRLHVRLSPACFFPSPEWKAAVVFWRRRLVDNQIWAPLAAIRTEDVQFFETLRFNHLVLPWNRNGSGVEFAVKRVVGRVETDPFDSGKLFDIQHVLGVDG